jgi:flagellar biosynthesis protein FliP
MSSSTEPNQGHPEKAYRVPDASASTVPPKPPEKWKLIKVFYFIVVIVALAVFAVGGVFVYNSFGILGLVVATVLVALGLALLGKFVLSS